MTVDALRRWAKKRPAGALRLAVAVETQGGAIGHTVCEWSREDVQTLDAGPGADCAALAVEQCQEYCDAELEPCKFVLRWFGQHDRVLSVISHRVAPSREALSGAGIGQAEDATPMSEGAMSARMLSALLATHRQLNVSLGTITTAYDRTLGALSQQLTTAYSRPAADEPRALSSEQREEVLARTDALRAAASKLPDVIELALAAVAQRVLPPADGGGEVVPLKGKRDAT